MTYTEYPNEAEKFKEKAGRIKEKLDNTEKDLQNVEKVFKVDLDEDYLTIKTLEANKKLLELITDAKENIASDIFFVNNEAYRLENEEKERIALEKEGKDDE